MHGLFNRALQVFLRDTGGEDIWLRIAERAGVPAEGFEVVLRYDDRLTRKMLAEAVNLLGKPKETLLEDLGTYLVSHPNTQSLRRLMRFGGATFRDFLWSLAELPCRAKLAVPDLRLPAVNVTSEGDTTFQIDCDDALPGTAHVLGGLIRGMADDYGVLILIDVRNELGGSQGVTVEIFENRFAPARPFPLIRAEGRA